MNLKGIASSDIVIDIHVMAFASYLTLTIRIKTISMSVSATRKPATLSEEVFCEIEKTIRAEKIHPLTRTYSPGRTAKQFYIVTL